MGVSADASYVLSGGMGALGLVTAQALAEEGAKSLLLMSRLRAGGVMWWVAAAEGKERCGKILGAQVGGWGI